MLRLTLVIFAIVWGVLIAALIVVARAEPALDPEEHTLWTLINDHRQAHGVQPVGLNENLTDAAEWMSGDMAANDRHSHIDSLGRGWPQRMTDFGYAADETMTGENIAWDAGSAQEAFDLMRGSPEHNAVMLAPYFWAIGIARDDGYWTVDFGGRGPAWFPGNTATPLSSMVVLPAATPEPTPVPAAIPVPAALPVTGTKP